MGSMSVANTSPAHYRITGYIFDLVRSENEAEEKRHQDDDQKTGEAKERGGLQKAERRGAYVC